MVPPEGQRHPGPLLVRGVTLLVVSASFGLVTFWTHRQALVALMALSPVSL